MAVETELKLSIPAGAVARLRRHPLLAGIKPQRQRLANTYYDTPALDLKRRRIALRHRQTAWGQLLTVKSAEPAAGGLAQRSEWEAPSLPGAFDFSHVDDRRLRAQLEELTPSLQPVFATDFLRTTWLLEPAPGVRIEMALDRGAVRCERDGGVHEDPICEIELELLEGAPSSLFDVALALQADLPLRPEIASKAERGFRLFQQMPQQPVRAGRSPVVPGMRPQAAFVAVALDCIGQLQRNEAGARVGDDPEFVHQARVAIRRLRSALRLWGALLPPGFREAFSPRWRDLAQLLGQARNLDVFVTETLPPMQAVFAETPALGRLAHLAERRRQHWHRAIRAAFEAPEFAALVLSFTAALYALPSDVSLVSLDEFLRRRLRRFAREVKAMADACTGHPEAHHRLRIAFKRLRYALEFAAPLLPAGKVRRYGVATAEMQALLGAMNDLAVAEALVAELRQRRTNDLVHGWLAGQAVLLHNLLPAVLDGFLEARPPWKG